MNLNNPFSLLLLFAAAIIIFFILSWLFGCGGPFNMMRDCYRTNLKDECTARLAQSTTCYTSNGEWNALGEVPKESAPNCEKVKKPVASCTNDSSRGDYSTQTGKYCCGRQPS